MKIKLCYSNEGASQGKPWRVDLEDANKTTIFCKKVIIKTWSETIIRDDASPPCVVQSDGDVSYHQESETVTVS